MTDQELINLVQSKTPQDLTLEEIQLLRSRLSESPMLQEILADQMQMDSYLADVLGRYNVSVDQILARASTADRPSHPMLSIMGWGVCLLMMGFVGTLLLTSAVSPTTEQIVALTAAGEGTAPADLNAGGPSGDAADALATVKASDNKTQHDESQNIGVVAADSPAGTASADASPATSEMPATEVAVVAPPIPSAPLPPAAELKAPDPKPLAVWQGPEHLGGDVRPLEDIAFTGPSPLDDSPDKSVLSRWFTPIAGSIEQGDLARFRRVGRLQGRAKLNAPLADGSTLRFTITEYVAIRFEFWEGNEGVAFYGYGEPRRHAWAAYKVRRADPNAAAVPYALLDTDREHAIRTRPGLIATYEIRCEQGSLALLRGNVQLLRVQAAPPAEVVFDGNAAFRHLSLVRSTGLPEQSPDATVTVTPVELDGPWLGSLQQGARLQKHADGSVELSVDNTPAITTVSMPLPSARLSEVVVRLGQTEPGTRVVFCDEQGIPKYAIGFFLDRRSNSLCYGPIHPSDGRVDWELSATDGPTPYAPAKPWLKFLSGPGILKFWIGEDGKRWTNALPPITNVEGPLSQVGISSVAFGKRSIRLEAVEVRELSDITSLASADLKKAAVVPDPPAADFSAWQAAVDKARPAETNLDAWRRACAIKTLLAGPTRPLTGALLEMLADGVVQGPGKFDRQIAALESIALFADTFEDPAALKRYVDRYEALGRRLYAAGDPRPYSRVSRILRESNLQSRHDLPIVLDSLLRAELYEAIYSRRWSDVRDFVGQVQFWNYEDPLLPWADAVAKHHLQGGATEYSLQLTPEQRHPLVEDFNKEGYNLLAEFEAALANKSYRDACQILTAAATTQALGLLPDFKDPGLLVSLSGAVNLAMQQHPDFRRTMREDFGALGSLKVKQATADGDADAVRAASIKFYGTDAAAEAHLWLGDRLLSSGDFARALNHYHQSRRSASAPILAEVAARERLAGAMLGSDLGKPIATPVALGGIQLAAADFEQMVAGMKTARASSTRVLPPEPASAAVALPAPSSFTLAAKARLDGDLGENPQAIPGGYAEGQIDWIARQLAATVHNGQLIVSNRFQVVGFDGTTGALKWQTALGGEHGQTHDWPRTPMHPLLLEKTLVVRRLVKAGPELAALDAETGKFLWRSKPGLIVASDPVVVQNQLLAVTVQRLEDKFKLYLSTFDLATGELVAEQELVTLRDSWWQQRHCHALVADQNVIVVVGGAVLCCDATGKVRWARRQDWIPPREDPFWIRQNFERPLLVDGRLYLSQPGVRTVECLDADTGRQYWLKVMPTVRSILGQVQDRLIVRTDDGLTALSKDTGKPLWQYDEPRLLDGVACGTDSILCTQMHTVPDSPQYSDPRMVWLDPATGKRRAYTDLPDLKNERPRFGPLVFSGAKLWAFYGRQDEPGRDLYELTASGPATVAAAQVPAEKNVALVRP